MGFRQLNDESTPLSEYLYKNHLDLILTLEAAKRARRESSTSVDGIHQGEFPLSIHEYEKFNTTIGKMRGALKRMKTKGIIADAHRTTSHKRPDASMQGEATIFKYLDNDFIKVQWEAAPKQNAYIGQSQRLTQRLKTASQVFTSTPALGYSHI